MNDTSSNEFKIECLARELLSWPLEKRRGYLDKMQNRQGEKSVNNLKEVMTAEHKKARSELKEI